MGLFKPKYLNEELSSIEREYALRKEKNPKKLRAVFEDPKMPYKLREYALQQEKDKEFLAHVVKNNNENKSFRIFALDWVGTADLCEWVLMNPAFNPSLNYEIDESHNQLYSIYFKAAYRLYRFGKQDILKEIFNTTPHDGIKKIVLQYITDEQFLYDVSMGDDGDSFVKAAVTNIRDNLLLKNIAICNERGTLRAIDNIYDQDCLKAIVLNVKDFYARNYAIKKITDPSSLIEPLRKELLPIIQKEYSYTEMELFARTGDTTARIIAYCYLGKHSPLVSELRIKPDEILNADLSVTYPIIKKLVASLPEDHSDTPREIAGALSNCIKLLHDNDLIEEIERDIPRVVNISGSYRDYYGDGYEKYTDEHYQDTVELY